MPPSSLTSPRRALAEQGVARALADFPYGRALARDLEAALAASGVSARQARRWMAWASAGAVVRLPKTQAGTLYCLPECTPAAEAMAEPPSPGPELAAVPRDCRRDVALALLSLLDAGGEAESRALAAAVAARAGRPLVWGVGSVDVAVGAAGRQVLRYRRDAAPGAPVLQLVADVEPGALAFWGRPPVFGLPRERSALEQQVRSSLAAPDLVLGAGEAQVLLALAGLGGVATPCELRAAPDTDPRAVAAVLAAARDVETRSAWLAWDGGARRLRLAAGLWPEGPNGERAG